MGMNNKKYIFITFSTNSLNKNGETKNNRYNIMTGGYMMVTGKYIKQLRIDSGLSQSELAKLARVSQAHVAKIENESVDPRLSTVNRILFVLSSRKKKLSCRDVMNTNIVSADPDMPIEKAIKLMRKFEISQVPVFQGKNNVGSISESTVVRNLGRNLKRLQIKHILDKPFPCVDSGDPVDILPGILDFHPAVLVSEKGRIKGIVTKSDLLQER